VFKIIFNGCLGLGASWSGNHPHHINHPQITLIMLGSGVEKDHLVLKEGTA